MKQNISKFTYQIEGSDELVKRTHETLLQKKFRGPFNQKNILEEVIAGYDIESNEKTFESIPLIIIPELMPQKNINPNSWNNILYNIKPIYHYLEYNKNEFNTITTHTANKDFMLFTYKFYTKNCEISQQINSQLWIKLFYLP